MGNDSREKQVLKGYSYSVESIFREYYSSLCYFAIRYVEDEIAGEDIVQDIFASLLEKKVEFSSTLHLKNFLYLSVKNACLNYLRKGNAYQKYAAKIGKESQEGEEYLVQNIIATEVYRELAEAVASLPPECRKVFEACYFEGLDNEKAAQKLGISIFTVKAQKARGKKILKENLRHLFPFIALILEFF